MKMKIKSTPVLFHVIGCSLFLLLPVIFWPGEGGIAEFFSDVRALRGYMTNVIILLFFYLNYYILIPQLYFKNRYLVFILILLLCYLVIAFLPEIFFPFKEHLGPPEGHRPDRGIRPDRIRWMFRMGHSLFFFLAVVFLSLLLKLNNRLKQAEKERLKAELSYFKAQINPHFLFNTLNTIYSLSILKDDKTPEAVVKLSGMMRYVISDASHDFVPLENEIKYISDYIDLQKIRFGDTVKIDYQPCEPAAGKYIAPLILIPFIENAFKFGVNPEEDSFISVKISFSEPELHLSVFNHKVHDLNGTEQKSGLGINNARQRLSLLYPDKYRLSIEDRAAEFVVDLDISLP